MANSLWDKAQAGAKVGWNGLYKAADTVGFWANKQVAKVGIEAFYPTSLEIESTKAARILRTFTLDAPDPDENYLDRKKKQKVVKKIPPSAIERCAGLAIFTVFRTGFVLSGAGGSGIVIARLEDGSWSAPSGILLHTLGWGLLAGADIYDVVLILRTPAALNSFIRPRVTIGGELTVAAGPIGNGVMLESGIEASPVWSYVKSKGLYGGLQIDGNIMIERPDENARAYFRPGVKAKDILSGVVRPPYWCEGLHQTIMAAEGRSTPRDKIPRGPSAGELDVQTARKLAKEDEDYDDQVARAELEEYLKLSGVDDPQINQRRQSMDEHLVRQSPVAGPSTSLVEAPIPEHAENPDSPLQDPPPAPAPPPRPPRRFLAPPNRLSTAVSGSSIPRIDAPNDPGPTGKKSPLTPPPDDLPVVDTLPEYTPAVDESVDGLSEMGTVAEKPHDPDKEEIV